MAAQQPLVTVSVPAVLAVGFIIGIVLLVVGLLEQKDRTQRAHLTGAGALLLGIMTVATPLLWYGCWPLLTGSVIIMSISEIAVLTLLGLVSGVLITYGIQLVRTRE
jgi:uncharacterized membrane protein